MSRAASWAEASDPQPLPLQTPRGSRTQRRWRPCGRRSTRPWRHTANTSTLSSREGEPAAPAPCPGPLPRGLSGPHPRPPGPRPDCHRLSRTAVGIRRRHRLRQGRCAEGGDPADALSHPCNSPETVRTRRVLVSVGYENEASGLLRPGREPLEAGPLRASPQQGRRPAQSGCLINVFRVCLPPDGGGTGRAGPHFWVHSARRTGGGLLLLCLSSYSSPSLRKGLSWQGVCPPAPDTRPPSPPPAPRCPLARAPDCAPLPPSLIWFGLN